MDIEIHEKHDENVYIKEELNDIKQRLEELDTKLNELLKKNENNEELNNSLGLLKKAYNIISSFCK